MPDWVVEESGETRICVSFGLRGTQSLVESGSLRPLVDTIGKALTVLDRPANAVLLLPDRYHVELGRVPNTVRVVGQTPINLVIPGSDLVIHHGGSGSTLTSFVYGVPQVAIAQEGALLVPIAQRTADVGAGRALITAEERDDPAAIGAAIVDVLDHECYRTEARRIGAEIAAQTAPAEIAVTVESLR